MELSLGFLEKPVFLVSLNLFPALGHPPVATAQWFLYLPNFFHKVAPVHPKIVSLI